MMQLEIPVETIEHVLTICQKSSIPVLLNPAPAKNFRKEWMNQITYLTPNETECELIFGADWETVLKEHPNKIIVTLGSEGAAFYDGKKIVRISGYKTMLLIHGSRGYVQWRICPCDLQRKTNRRSGTICQYCRIPFRGKVWGPRRHAKVG